MDAILRWPVRCTLMGCSFFFRFFVSAPHFRGLESGEHVCQRVPPPGQPFAGRQLDALRLP